MGGARATYTYYTLPGSDKCYVIKKIVLYHDIEFLRSAGVTDLPQPYDVAAIDELFMNILSTFRTANRDAGTASSTVPEMI